MARFTLWAQVGHPDDALLSSLHSEEWLRKETIWRVQNDLVTLALGLGQSTAEAATKVDALFSTFAAEWAIYVLTGSPAIITAIQDDATIPWLDLDIAGTSIRQRLINRLAP